MPFLLSKKNVVEIIFLPFPIYCTGISLSPFSVLNVALLRYDTQAYEERKKPRNEEAKRSDIIIEIFLSSIIAA
jgi:hypothetical protein